MSNIQDKIKERVEQVADHLKPILSPNGRADILTKRPDDIVTVLAVRTPLTKAKKGGLKDTKLDGLLYSIFKSVIEKSGVPPEIVEDIVVGNVNSGNAAHYSRMAALAAGFPSTTAVQVINRYCSSGLMSIISVANAIKVGSIEVGLAIGAETMSAESDRNGFDFTDVVLENEEAQQCLQPMGQTSENVAEDFNLKREDMDAFAARSYQRAEEAQKNGWFDAEIVPVKTTVLDKEGNEKEITVTKDDGIRPGTTAEGLAKVRPAFPQWGKGLSTGGNSSQVTDGAAACLLMKRSKAEELGLKVIGKFVQGTVIGLAPRIMGIGPSIAIPKILKLTNLTKEDVDVFEINEAFASMGVYCVNKLELPIEKVNPTGGAIALGHPLGCTGARQVATALSYAHRTGKKVIVTSMCVGAGQGGAAVWVAE